MSNILHKGVPINASTLDNVPTPQKDVEDDEYATLPLPSGGVFYPSDVKDILVRRFDILDIDKMSSAKKSANMGDYIRAIGATVSVPVEMLTQDDFQFLCFWHRVNSYPTRPLQLKWECTNEKHKSFAALEPYEGMSEDDKLDLEDAKRFVTNTVTIRNSSEISINKMTMERYNKLKDWLTDPTRHTKDFIFMPPVVGDLIEFSEISQAQLKHLKLSELDTTPENLETVLDEINDATQDDTIIRIASNLNAKYGVTLTDRMAYVREQTARNRRTFSTAFLSDLETFEELSNHSVNESYKGTCKYRGCKQAVNLSVDFDLFNFFPFV